MLRRGMCERIHSLCGASVLFEGHGLWALNEGHVFPSASRDQMVKSC